MIGLWIEAQDDEVLGRLARAKVWIAGLDGWPDEYNGAACMVVHAKPQYCRGPMLGDDFDAALRFDDLCYRFDPARIGRAISERARRVLEERHPDRYWQRFSPYTGEIECGLWSVEAPAHVPASLPTNREPVEVGA